MEREKFAPALEQLNRQVRSFAQSKGYDLVLGTMAGGNVLAADRSVDVTDEFLAYVRGEH